LRADGRLCSALGRVVAAALLSVPMRTRGQLPGRCRGA
jgi:hypothetical protein